VHIPDLFKGYLNTVDRMTLELVWQHEYTDAVLEAPDTQRNPLLFARGN
jgi:hypothetical protein